MTPDGARPLPRRPAAPRQAIAPGAPDGYSDSTHGMAKGGATVRTHLLGAAILVLALGVAGCGQPSSTAAGPSRTDAAGPRIDCEEAACRCVQAYIRREGVDVSGLEFYFATRKDMTGKMSSLPGDFGPELWLVKYGRERGRDGAMTAGAGILFYVDARTERILVWRERD